MSESQIELCQTREAQLVHRYGQLMTLTDLADVLRYPSVQALRKARIRGQLPLELIRFPNRHGWSVLLRHQHCKSTLRDCTVFFARYYYRVNDKITLINNILQFFLHCANFRAWSNLSGTAAK